MIGSLSGATATRLEKAAIDNGFDQELTCEKGWMGFASTQAPLRIWLTALGEELFLITFSQAQVARALDQGIPMTSPLPEGATAGRTVTNIPALHRLVRRAFQLSWTLPDELLHTFEKETVDLPRNTEAPIPGLEPVRGAQRGVLVQDSGRQGHLRRSREGGASHQFPGRGPNPLSSESKKV